MQLKERLVGLGLMALAVSLLAGVVTLWWFGRMLQPEIPLPPGIRRDMVPVLTPFACIVPLTAVGAGLLFLVGLRKFISPD
ncbi:MAG: hypothetical protein U0821_10565 [Chloroflexota bacterium]